MKLLILFSCLWALSMAIPAPSASATVPTNVSTVSDIYPMPEPCTGPACANAYGTLDYQDASFVKRASDGLYFRFAKSNATGHGISVANAPTISGPWTYSYEVLAGKLTNPIVSNRSDTDVWAPELHYINNLYYLYYTIFTEGNSNPAWVMDLCVATSPTMDMDDWTDHGSMGVPLPKSGVQNYARLDGTLFARALDPQGVAGRPYMAFGSYGWGLYGFEVSDKYLTIAPGANVTEVVVDQYNPGTDPGNKTEGAFLFGRGEYIYLFYSEGQCCSAYSPSYDDTVYKTKYCRASLVDGPAGPYHDQSGLRCGTSMNNAGTVLLETHANGQVFSPGSVSIMKEGEDLIMHYQYRNGSGNGGMAFSYNYLSFDSDGWPSLVANPSLT